MPNLEKTGFCWQCGLQCKGLFCEKKNAKDESICENKYTREKRALRGKRDRQKYGLASNIYT